MKRLLGERRVLIAGGPTKSQTYDGSEFSVFMGLGPKEGEKEQLEGVPLAGFPQHTTKRWRFRRGEAGSQEARKSFFSFHV